MNRTGDIPTDVRMHVAEIYHTLHRFGFTLFLEPNEGRPGEHLQYKEDRDFADDEAAFQGDPETIDHYLTMALDWSDDMMEYIRIINKGEAS